MAARAEVGEMRDLYAPDVVAVVPDVRHPHEPRRIAKGHGPQQYAVDETEDGRARTDAERHDRERERGEARVSPQRTEGVAQVAAQEVERVAPAQASLLPSGGRVEMPPF